MESSLASPSSVHVQRKANLSLTETCLFLCQRPKQVALLQAYGSQVVTIEEAGPDRCRMTLGGEVSVKIPGLGPLAERVLVDSISASLRLLPFLVRIAPLQ